MFTSSVDAVMMDWLLGILSKKCFWLGRLIEKKMKKRVIQKVCFEQDDTLVGIEIGKKTESGIVSRREKTSSHNSEKKVM